MGRKLDKNVKKGVVRVMKVVILAGGLGTRISEESHLKPKPMIEIGGMPIIWHIMKIYSHYGFNDFVICAGYKQYVIKEFFANYFFHRSNITFDFTNGKQDIVIHDNLLEPWKVTVVDTGLNTMTGGRIKRIKDYIDNEDFFLTYGDGVSDVDLNELLKYHKNNGKLLTLMGIKPESRFGIMDLSEDGSIVSFREKSRQDSDWINGGFMICSPKVIDHISGDDTTFEREPLEQLAASGEAVCYRHDGFWQCMDTLRDKNRMEEMWESGKAPWKVWD